MKNYSALVMVLLPVVVGVWFLVKFYKSERLAGRAAGMFFNREAEGRWGSTLIMMGSVLFFVLGSESQWFVPRELEGIVVGIGGVLLIAALAEAVAWLLGKRED